MKNFEIGQIWTDGMNREFQVIEINDGTYPVEGLLVGTDGGIAFTLDGRKLYGHRGEGDLSELIIEDARDHCFERRRDE